METSPHKSFNYRRRYDPVKMNELVEDIKLQGVISPITVRKKCEAGEVQSPLPQLIKIRDIKAGLYEVVAGTRRTMAFDIVHGDEGEIPAVVRVMSDEEAIALMVSENKVREDTTAIEDAEAATRMLGLQKGDKAETARRLGWKPDKLERRLAIMNATDSVRDAFIDDKIKLGHVEILAAFRREAQESVLSKILAAPKCPTVEELKGIAENALLGLEAAIFDKTDCVGCQYNTGNQQALFDESFSGSRCTNQECYNAKTETELETRRASLTETYQVVRIVRPGDNLTVQPLKVDGPKGVGEEQAKACRTCGDFGACVSAAPDQLGRIFKEVCFNTPCNSEKIAANLAATKAAEKAQEESASAPQEAADTSTDQPGENARAAAAKAKPATPVASSAPRNAVREYRESIWRAVLNRAALKMPVEKSRALLLVMCLYRPSTLDSHAAAKAVAAATNKAELKTLSAAKLAKELLTFGIPELGLALQQIPAFTSTQLEINAVTEILSAFEVKLESFWKVNETFFELLTKTEIDAVCVEIGIAAAMGEGYAKVKNGSKADLVKAVLAVKDFEYVGKIPQLMRW